MRVRQRLNVQVRLALPCEGDTPMVRRVDPPGRNDQIVTDTLLHPKSLQRTT